MVKSLHQRVVLMSAKKKILKRTDKERFLSTKRSFWSRWDVPEDDALLVFMLLMKREPRRAKSSQTEKSLSPPVNRYPRSLFQKRNERERDEKEIQRYLKLRLVSRSLPFSSRCGCFSCGTKKRLKSFEKRVPWRRCGSWIGWKQPRTAWVGWSVATRRNYFERQFRVFCLRGGYEKRDWFLPLALKGLIPTWVANLPATERKKKTSARARA